MTDPSRGGMTKSVRHPRNAGVLKFGAFVVALFMLSTVLGGSADNDLKARTSATGVGYFGAPVIMNDNRMNDQANPVIAVIPGSGLFAVWEDMRSGYEDVYSSRSTNNGSTFSANKRVDDSTGSSEQKEPAVAVSSNGTVFVAWQDNRRSTFDKDVYFAKSYDGGQTFTKNIRVDDATPLISWQERPSIAVTNTGSVYVAWTDDRNGPPLRIRGAYSMDWGTTFSKSEEMVPDAGNYGQSSVQLVTSGNRIFAAFIENRSSVPHAFACYSTNGGKSFSTPVRLDDTGAGNASQFGVAIAPAPGGGIVAAWRDNRGGTFDIYLTTVSWKGTITSPNIRVDDDTTGSFQGEPSVASDQFGNIYVAWQDERDGPAAIRFSYLIPGRLSFNSSIAVSAPGPNDWQRTPSVVAVRPGLVFVAWQDDKAATYDVYCASAYFPGLFGISLLDGWNFVSIPSDVTGLKASSLGLRTGDTISSWNSTRQSFSQSYMVGISPPSFDFALSPSTGYWINTGAHELVKLNLSVPTSKQAKQFTVPRGGGWVVLGFESLNTSRSASDVPKMTNISGSILAVAGYDFATNSYVSYAAGYPITDFILAPGQAYWCWLTTNSTLTYSP